MKQLTNILFAAKRSLLRLVKQLFAAEQAEITVEFKGKKIVQRYRIIKNGV